MLCTVLYGCAPYSLINPSYEIINDIDYNNRRGDAFRLYIDSISSNRDSPQEYYLRSELVKFDSNGILIENRWGLALAQQNYQEVEKDIHLALQKSGYHKALNFRKPYLNISVSYGMGAQDMSKHSMPTLYAKVIHAGAYDSSKFVPLWTTFCSVQDNSIELRLYLPAMIKCVTPYFNKNFKGTITCKR
jgi:hypothetical protein